MLAFDGTRDVVALDHIGYGNSAKRDTPLTTTEHAESIGDALDDLGKRITQSSDFDVMGYHSGSTFAGELALLRGGLVTKLVFVTYPYLDAEGREARLAEIADHTWLSDDLVSLEGKWTTNIGRRAKGVPLERGVANLVDDLKGGANAWHGFHAVFTYAAEDRLPLILQQTLVINTDSMLTEPTAQANSFLKNAEYHELSHMKLGIYELHADELARTISDFLDAPLEPYAPHKP